MSLLLGLDVGSSACKAMLVSADGEIAAQADRSYPTLVPRNGWAEQDPEDWYEAACAATRECLAAADVRSEEVDAVGVAGPAHNVAVLGADGRPVHATIHWSDVRATQQASELQRLHGEHIFGATMTEVHASWTLAQIAWLRDEYPHLHERIRTILVTKDYVRFRLTGVLATDEYDAVGTQFYDARERGWSSALLELAGLSLDHVPPVRGPADLAGHITSDAARDTGLLQGTPVAVGSGDSVVEAFGIGAVGIGDTILKLGTSANVNVVTGSPKPSMTTLTYPHVMPERWMTIAATNTGASTRAWFRSAFSRAHEEASRDWVDAVAEHVPVGAEGLMFHPFLRGERSPYFDPYLRGSFIGINGRHSLPHFARAVLEGVALSLADCMEAVRTLGISLSDRVFLIGGGSRSPLWSSIVCNVIGLPVIKPAVADAALGAALVAGRAIGMYSTWDEALALCGKGSTKLDPDPEVTAHYRDLLRVYRSLVAAIAEHHHELVDIAERNRPAHAGSPSNPTSADLLGKGTTP